MDLQNLMIMKTLKDLKAFSLDKKQMNQIEGGSQYCEHLQQMTRGEEAQGWSNEKWDEWAEAWADVQAEITLKSRNWSDGRWIVWEEDFANLC